MSHDPSATLRAIAADPYNGWSERQPGRRAIGVLCTYAPVEVLHAAGLVPVRLMPGATSAGLAGADRHLQTYTCAIARGVLAAATAGQWQWLAGVVFPHTCDTIQALADVWREARPASYVGTLVGPVAVESPAAETYLVAELRRFIADLEAHLGLTVTDDALRASIHAYNENRRLLLDLRGRLPYSDWLTFALAGQIMPIEEHTGLLMALAQGSLLSRGKEPGVQVVLVGAVLDDPALPAFIQELGASVVDDDLCTGRRAVETRVDETRADPVLALARRELRRPPCPARYAPGQPPAERLVRLAQDSHAHGVILLQQKFCEPHAFDLPALRAALDRAGISHLTLDMEGSALDGALRTRVQAFLELLQ
ncbi:MAG: 2-hydroxyacyl-CoA dehydratase family protein [Chloroflexi bacterium]|nr:2-hydroxyacyl-CoA dehydratase family protein [Chloroflexota bacterium]MBU1747904.1 2-hydroxyacyl-CoA dehydratase family protein [Chloroflexota bacterium]